MSMPAVEENVVPSNASSQISLSALAQNVVPSNTSSQISLNCLAQNVVPSDASSEISYSLTQDPIQALSDPIQALSESTEHPDDSQQDDDTENNEMLDDTPDSNTVTCHREREGNRSSIGNSTQLDACFEALMKSSRNDFATNLERYSNMLSDLVTKSDERTGDTLLHKAARYLDWRSCIILLRNNARINKPNKMKALPLHFACEGSSSSNTQGLTEDNKKVITSLINDYQESLKHQNSSGLTPLHIAAMRGSRSKCEVIVDHIVVDRGHILELVTDREKRTPLHTAVIYKKNDVVKYMYRKNSDFGYASAKDEKGRTPLDVACELGFFQTVKCILKRSEVQFTDLYNAYETPLKLAIENNHPKVMDLLLENGATCNSQNSEGPSALHMAMKQKDIMMFKRLLDNGADVGFQDVVKAIKMGRVDILEEILKKHPKCISEERNGIITNTILHEAVKSEHSKELVLWMKEKHKDVLKKFIQSSVTIDGKKDKKTPLGLAASKHKPETVRLLLENLPESIPGPETQSPTPCQDDVGNTFKEALLSKNREVVCDILESDIWRIALAQGDFAVSEDKPRKLTNPPPLRKLLETMPEMAEKALWKCIYIEDEQNEERGEESDEPGIGNCELDFSFIDDTYTDYYKEKYGVQAHTRYHKRGKKGSLTTRYYEIDTPKSVIKAEHPLMYMIRAIEKQHKGDGEKRIALMKHPLFLVVIRHMWGRTATLYLPFVLLYISFTILLSAYLTYVHRPYSPTGNYTACTVNTQHRPAELALKILIGLLCVGGIALEVALASNQRRMYKVYNISYWAVYLGVILVIIPFECQVPTLWQWHIGAFTLLGAWLNVLFLLGWLPVIGIYVNMIKVIFRTFLKFAVLWVVAVMSFAVPHHMLFYNQGPFTNLWVSSVKTAVMAFGEFDYTSIFHGEGTENVLYKHTSRIIFVIFMALMTMIIMNMMIALAVEDVGSLLKRGKIMKLKLLIDMALSVQLALPGHIRKRTDTYEQNVIKLDAKLNCIETLLVLFERKGFSNKELLRLIKENKAKCSHGRLMTRDQNGLETK